MIADPRLGLEDLLAQVEGKPVAMVALARLLRTQDPQRATSLCERALEMAPEDGEVRAGTAEVLSAEVPRWHFGIVRDAVRNAAYEAALRRAVFPGCKVLEIGTGTGLLSMMAARAGAAEVITCESNFAIASAAKEIIARNGYADRVRIAVKHSTALDVQADLGGPADILVSEIVSDDLLGEGVLPVLEHACGRLLKPGAAVIPARGHIRVALAFDDDWQEARMPRGTGFDLSAFDRLAAPRYEVYVGAARLMLRSDPADLFSFDFASDTSSPEQRSARTLAAHGRRINGIAQWIALDMDAEGRVENQPEPGTNSSWMAVFHPFEREVQTAAGQLVTVHGRHDRGALRIWADIGR